MSWLVLLTLSCGWVIALLMLALGRLELRGDSAFALVLVSVLADVAILLAYGADLRAGRMSRINWIVVALVCLTFVLYVGNLDDPDARKAAEVVLLTTMLVLSFPFGTLGIAAVVAYSALVLSARSAGARELSAFWLMFAGLGYVQWFRLLPWMILKRRSGQERSSGRAETSS